MKYLIGILLLTGAVYSQCNKHNWQDYYNSDGRDMRGCDLTKANLYKADLTGADLPGANLEDAYLRGANLTGADLSEANLEDANLRGADLTGAILPEGWIMVNGYLIGPGAVLFGVNLSGADLSGVDLRGADLRDAKLDSSDLSDANLKGADLTGANLTDANLTGAILPEGWIMVNGYLIGPEAVLIGANLSGADLSEANLKDADLSGSDLSGADLEGANLRGTDLTDANLKKANLINTKLDGADLTKANLLWADLRGANLTDANLKEANLSWVISERILGTPKSLPKGWSLDDGVLMHNWLMGNLSTKSYAGIYSYNWDPDAETQGSKGRLIIYPETENTILFHLWLSTGPPSHNQGSLYDRLDMNGVVGNGVGIYIKDLGYGDNPCKWEMRIDEDWASITGIGSPHTQDNDCGFGARVSADGVYGKDSNDIPLYFEKASPPYNYISFKDTKPKDPQLHESINEYLRAVFEWEMERFTVRVDDMGEEGYRYVSWGKTKKQNQKPDLIIMNGSLILDGSGGNHVYSFRNGDYEYRCAVVVMGEEGNVNDFLIVERNGEVILRQKRVR